MQLDEWEKQAHHYAHMYYERYSRALNAPKKFSSAYTTHLINISRRYFDLRMLLLHIRLYGKIRDEENCMACKYDSGSHIKKVERLYRQYESWIKRSLAF